MHKTRYTTFPEGGKCTLLPMPAVGMGKRGHLPLLPMPAAGMGKRGHLPPPLWKCCNVFLCISSYSSVGTPADISSLFGLL